MTNTVVWTPSTPQNSRMWQFMRFVERAYDQTFAHYAQLYQWSIQQPTQFWQALCDFFQLYFNTPPHQILSHGNDMLHAKWFVGARFNFAEKLLSCAEEKLAIIAVNEQGQRQTFSYQHLKHQVACCALGLKQAGVQMGDRVAGFMPNVAETVIAMLATTSIGAIWSSCSPDFGADAACDRLGQIQPKILFTCDGQIYHGKKFDLLTKVQQLITLIPSLQQVVVCPLIDVKNPLITLPKTISWSNFLQPATGLTFVPLPFDHPLYILFSSGTTGKPKCIMHGAGGTLLQHIKELGLHTDLRAQDNLCFYTTCGWMMWNWMISALALGTTITLYEGSPTFPDNNRLFQLMEQEKITVFGTSAKYLSSIEKSGFTPQQHYSLPTLRCILSTGSPLLPQQYDFVTQHVKAGVQISSISGGTDIISCFALGNPLLPVYRGELQCIGLGLAVQIFDEQGQALQQKRGELVCTKPFPAMPIGFWHDPDKTLFRQTYFERFPGIWAHGDFAEITIHQGLIIYGRSDAILNPGGVRIGTAEIYRQVEKIPDILESIVVGQQWQDDVRVILFVKLRPGLQLTEALQSDIRQLLRTHASPRHVPAKILQVPDIPRTINNKIVELAVKQVVHNQPVLNTQSLANPEALAYFKDRIELRD